MSAMFLKYDFLYGFATKLLAYVSFKSSFVVMLMNANLWWYKQSKITSKEEISQITIEISGYGDTPKL